MVCFVDAQLHFLDSGLLQLRADGGDGVVDPGADGRVAVLAHGVVVGACGEKGASWVDGAEVEDVVGADCEEGGNCVKESTVGGEEVSR